MIHFSFIFSLLDDLAKNLLGKRVLGVPKDADIIIVDVSMLSPSSSRHTDIIFHVYERDEAESSEEPSLQWSGHHYVEQQGQEDEPDRL